MNHSRKALLEPLTASFIGNSFVKEEASAFRRPIVCPVTSSVIHHVYDSTPTTIQRGVASARTAFQSWKLTTGSERRDALLGIASAFRAHIDELSFLEALGGKTIRDARWDVESTIDYLQYFAGHADKIEGRTFSVNPRFRTFTQREPVGVTALVTAFNYPLLIAVWKLAPALACGNTVVIKPPPQTPLSTLYMASLASAHLPPGVLTVLPGGAESSQQICEHPEIDLISFTGSTQTGAAIGATAARAMKRVILELGGKNAFVVCPSADLDLAVEGLVDAAFGNAGQNCCAASRLFLDETIHDVFMQKLLARIRKIQIGDNMDERTDLGPLVDERHFENVRQFIERAKQQAHIQLVAGGSRHGSSGYFVEPTVFQNVDDADELGQTEVFGPVLVVMKPFKSLDEAIARTNGTQYGLTASVWSEKNAEIERFVRRVNVGLVWANCHNDTPSYLPFGGQKMSGIGKECGSAALDQFSATKSVHIRVDV
ncbi:aldehyde dehydrogenase domain-containing protein [Polychytrium aggregatum]|uniref:aldehyde dehydrogenase domain-containing protein n=1 Tax=Polychytrium aggregatum TaxID=110093 RepID=UPI0022FF1C9C|nr:aldehyde dehydrogenase domain-containing protein [Polychytrium aggregatum]KAI9203665.1 aldehyde dehydrogenase domain-containing protein [Polychytrium aggregatum]